LPPSITPRSCFFLAHRITTLTPDFVTMQLQRNFGDGGLSLITDATSMRHGESTHKMP
jgi:hypothetical protein